MSMKKALLFFVFIVAGYKAYATYFISPLIGQWQPDKEYALKKAVAAGISAEQKSDLLTSLDQLKLSISDKKMTFTFPDRNGEFDYTAEENSSGCYDLQIKEIGHSVACIKEGKLEVTNLDTGTIDLFNKVS